MSLTLRAQRHQLTTAGARWRRGRGFVWLSVYAHSMDLHASQCEGYALLHDRTFETVQYFQSYASCGGGGGKTREYRHM